MELRPKPLVMLLLLAISLGIQAQTIDNKISGTDGPVFASAQKGDTLYIGGYFNYAGYECRGLAHFIKDSARPDLNFPQVTGNITSVISDDAGGYFAGGSSLKYVNGFDVSNNGNNNVLLVHIKAGNTLDSNFIIKDLAASGSISSLKKVNNKLYLAGTFTGINGISRPSLAEMNASSGTLTNWKPVLNPAVDFPTMVEATDSLVFVTGEFSNSYVRMRAFKVSDGEIANGIPTVSGSATIKINGKNLYVATSARYAGFNASGMGKFNATTGWQDPNFPVVDGFINAVADDGKGGYYLGGYFSLVNSIAKSNLVHVLANGAVDTTLNISADGTVNCFASDGTTLYIGGDFTTINNTSRTFAAAISLATGALTQWNPKPNGRVLTMVYSNNTIYLGGAFLKVGKTARNKAASVTTTGVLTVWNPIVNGDVTCILPNQNGSSLYLGGYFNMVHNKTKYNICKVDNNKGLLVSAFTASTTSTVQAMALDGSQLYLGGYFYKVGNVTRNYLASVDTTTGATTSFNPILNSYVTGLNIINGKLYVGGNFSTIGTTAQRLCARFDLKTKTLDSWDPHVVDVINSTDHQVNTFFPISGDVLIGGNFSLGNAVSINLITSINTKTGAFGNFYPKNDSIYGEINSLEFLGKEVFAGGMLSRLKSDNNWKYGVFSFDTTTGLLKRSYEQFQNGDPVTALKIKNNSLFIGGGFTQLLKAGNGGIIPRLNMCSYNLTADTLESTIYDLDKKVTGLLADSSGIIATGDFSLAKALPRQNLAAINLKTGATTGFQPTASSGTVLSMALKDSLLYVAGEFNEINRIPRNHLAAVNTYNSQTANWMCNVDNVIHNLFLKDSTLYVMGSFSSVNSINRNNIAAVTTGNATVLAWNPNPDGQVGTMAYANDKFYLGGSFRNCGGQPRQFLAEVDAAGNALSWNPSPSNIINVLFADNSSLYVGGGFMYINHEIVNSLCRFNLNNDSIDLNFHPALGGNDMWISSLAKYNDNLFTGGLNIADENNVALGNLSAINTNTGAISFKANPNFDFYPNNSNVETVNVFGNRLVAGGSWTDLINYSPQSNLAVFNLDSLIPSPVLVFNNVQATTINAGFFNLGTGNKLVIIKKDTMPVLPTNGRYYNASTIYGNGDTTGKNSFVLYNGSDSVINITGLRPNNAYYLAVVPYVGNGTGTVYKNSSVLSGSFNTICNTGNLQIDSSGPLSLCPSKTVSLWTTPGYHDYLWNNGQTTDTITVSTPNFYYVFATDSNNCRYGSIGVTITSLPCASPKGLNVTNIAKTTAQLNWGAANCGVSYQYQWRKKGVTAWSKGQITTTNKIITGLAAGTTYQWRVATYCETSPQVIISPYTNGVEFTTATSLAFNASPNYVNATVLGHLSATLIPNPVINTAAVVLKNVKGVAGITVTDINGKKIWSLDKTSSLTVAIPVTTLSTGIYFVKIYDDEAVITLKLIKAN